MRKRGSGCGFMPSLYPLGPIDDPGHVDRVDTIDLRAAHRPAMHRGAARGGECMVDGRFVGRVQFADGWC